jgi:N-hydroxyarylamine O-acetyltransferase
MSSRNNMDREKYLARIGIENAGLIPDLGVLKMLQRQHLLNVPFENLDIHWQRPIVLDTEVFYRKIVEENRGGFCYELNGLFNELLRDIGFQTRIVSARVANANGGHGPEYDHLAILVIIGETHYLADVGFGSFTTEPLELRPDVEQSDPAGVFVIREHTEDYFEVVKKNGDGLQSEYIFKPLGRDLSEFTEMCEFQQYSPESHFRKGKICSILTETGRKTLTDNKFILTADDKKSETAVGSPDEFDTILLREFGIAKDHAAVSLSSI